MLQDPYQVERLMQIFLHDVRSPIGVAQGYLHLLAGEKLPEDARPRALHGVSEAVNKMARLVDAVSMLLERDGPPGHQSRVPVAQVCARVRHEAEACGVHVETQASFPDQVVRVGASLDRLAEALSTVLQFAESDAQRATAGPMTLGIIIDAGELRFTTGRGGVPAPGHGPMTPCDPWEAGKLDYLVAHRHLSAAQGAVWCKVGESRACSVTLPLEVRPA